MIKYFNQECPRGDSNPHTFRQLILNQSWLPLHHPGKVLDARIELAYIRL